MRCTLKTNWSHYWPVLCDPTGKVRKSEAWPLGPNDIKLTFKHRKKGPETCQFATYDCMQVTFLFKCSETYITCISSCPTFCSTWAALVVWAPGFNMAASRHQISKELWKQVPLCVWKVVSKCISEIMTPVGTVTQACSSSLQWQRQGCRHKLHGRTAHSKTILMKKNRIKSVLF